MLAPTTDASNRLTTAIAIKRHAVMQRAVRAGNWLHCQPALFCWAMPLRNVVRTTHSCCAGAIRVRRRRLLPTCNAYLPQDWRLQTLASSHPIAHRCAGHTAASPSICAMPSWLLQAPAYHFSRSRCVWLTEAKDASYRGDCYT
jgi:hypothetical protein